MGENVSQCGLAWRGVASAPSAELLEKVTVLLCFQPADGDLEGVGIAERAGQRAWGDLHGCVDRGSGGAGRV